MTVHELKIWPRYFEPVLQGIKTFERRDWDRDFQVGDIIHLREFDPIMGYSGRTLDAEITYILDGPLREKDVCLMSIKKVEV